jgi:prephenate dehydratase
LIRVGFLGPAGTYSEEALRTSAQGDVEEVPYPTIYQAVMAVETGEIDRSVVPIENALEGAVAVTLDTLALEAGRVRIVAEVVHPIHHCVVAARPLDLADVTRVFSHPQATAQCARFLRGRLPQAELVIAASTADAVLSVRDASEPVVALGSRLAAELYGCRVIAADVEDHPDNATRFVWLADRGVNLTRIESRPRRTALGHYMFFADLEGGAGRPPVSAALEALGARVEVLRVLGSYTIASGASG